MPPGPTVLSCHPSSGTFGTKVFLKVSSQYDVFSMPHCFSLYFGSEKCPVSDVTRDSQDSTGFVYSCSADAPQLLVTGCSGNNVPLSLLIEGPSGEEISRAVAGSFQYLDGAGDITRTDRTSKHDASAAATQLDQASTSPKSGEPQITTDTTTNTYDYPAQQPHYQNAFPQGNNDMITAYRSSSFAEQPYRRPSAGGAGGWNFASPMGTRNSAGIDPVTGRSSLGSLPMSSSAGGSGAAPQLIRTSTISSGSAGNSPYHVSLFSNKAQLKISGKLDTMTEGWTHEEWENRRRIVRFRKTQTGSTLTATFHPVPVNERPPNSICVSCIYWAEKGECYVTSVDTIQLLEQLVAAPNRFSVEEKNRIRRNLEGFHPFTVSKAKADSEEFFKLIMGFPNPKPRNIEKDVKVFPWKILESALKKIISKYSASPSSTVPAPNMAPPISSTPYAALPTPPGHNMPPQAPLASHHGEMAGHYQVASNHHEAIPSPRSLSGSHQSWTPYTTAPYAPVPGRVLSPNMRNGSPNQGPPMRINTNTLPSVTTYDSRTVSAGSYGHGGLHTPISHHPSTATPPRWDSNAASYGEAYPSLTAQHGHGGSAVYSTTGYGDTTPRA